MNTIKYRRVMIPLTGKFMDVPEDIQEISIIPSFPEPRYYAGSQLPELKPLEAVRLRIELHDGGQYIATRE